MDEREVGRAVDPQAEVAVGAAASPEELYQVATAEDVSALGAKLDAKALTVKPGERQPFLVLFYEYPPELADYRLKLTVPVALDRDGVAAARYAVTSIPQVVVIDRDGKVARLYVGGGKETADQLRAALQAITDK